MTTASIAPGVTAQPAPDRRTRVVFDAANVRDLRNPNFGCPINEPEDVADFGVLAPYCAECGEFHEQLDPAPVPAGRPKPYTVADATWDQVDPRTLGPAARRTWEVAFGPGQYAAARYKISVPPMHFDAMERAAFRLGFAAYEDMHDDEFACAGNTYGVD